MTYICKINRRNISHIIFLQILKKNSIALLYCPNLLFKDERWTMWNFMRRVCLHKLRNHIIIVWKLFKFYLISFKKLVQLLTIDERAMKSKVLCHNIQFNPIEGPSSGCDERRSRTKLHVLSSRNIIPMRNCDRYVRAMWKYLDALIQRCLSAFSLLSPITIDCTLTSVIFFS